MVINMIMFTNFLSILPEPPTGTPAELAADGLGFFELWITRIGLLVAFAGAIRLVLSLGSDDGREKIQAILTMVSGFIISGSVSQLEVFSFGAGSAEEEFAAIISYFCGWVARAGIAAMLFGGFALVLSFKDNNAGTQVSALKTLAIGGMIISLSAFLPTIV